MLIVPTRFAVQNRPRPQPRQTQGQGPAVTPWDQPSAPQDENAATGTLMNSLPSTAMAQQRQRWEPEPRAGSSPFDMAPVPSPFDIPFFNNQQQTDPQQNGSRPASPDPVLDDYDLDPEADPLLLPPPPPTTTWANIRRQAGLQQSAWDRIRKGEKVNTGVYEFESVPPREERQPEPERIVNLRNSARPIRNNEMAPGQGQSQTQAPTYVPRTREEREELERSQRIQRNAWGDPV